MASPPPINDNIGSHAWLDWFRQIDREIRSFSSVVWGNINFSGSNITDITTRNHNQLQSHDGGTSGQYYHLTQAQHTEATTFFANTNITGAEAETLSNGSNADSLHTHDALTLGAAEVVSPPSSASDTGTAGQIAYDGSYFYVCTAANTWLRAPIATW
jgi:hypothetical protein